MKRFTVESIITFYEAHVVEAENEEQAKLIATQSDANVSKFLGQQVANISEFDERDVPRLLKLDTYFYRGYACMNSEGQLYYKQLEEKPE